MPNQITLTQRDAFELGLSKTYRDTVKLQKKHYARWLRQETTRKFYEDSHDWSGLGVIQPKALGQTMLTDTIYEGDRKTHALKTWGLALVIQEEVLEYDLYGIFKPLMRELSRSTTDRYNIETFAILSNAFSTANALYTDLRGEAICSTTHSRLDGGTWSNALTTGLSFLGLIEADILLRKQVQERGRFAMVEASQLLCSIDLEWIANTIHATTGRPGTSDNDTNVMKGRFKPYSSPYFTSTTAWFLWSKEDVDIWLRIGKAPQLRFDSDIRARNRLGTVYCAFNVAVDKGRGAIGSTGAG